MIIYAQPISEKIRLDIKAQISTYAKNNRPPKLVVILVGENKASQKYVSAKQKACEEIGIVSEKIYLDENTSEENLLVVIDTLNNDNSVDGILVQLPLPMHMDVNKVIERIDPNKDVDGFHPHHMGNVLMNRDSIVSCTPKGIMAFFEYTDYDLSGKNVVIVGRSNIVAKPLVGLLLAKDATVTVTHSKTKNLKEITKNADVVIVAIGKAKFINQEYISEDTFVIDVGINVDENNKLCGDVDFDSVHEKCSFITPVPKGVGVMTITMLLYNTLQLYIKHIQNN